MSQSSSVYSNGGTTAAEVLPFMTREHIFMFTTVLTGHFILYAVNKAPNFVGAMFFTRNPGMFWT